MLEITGLLALQIDLACAQAYWAWEAEIAQQQRQEAAQEGF